MWIDTILINQDDEEEKIAHISLMNNIYRKAEGCGYGSIFPNTKSILRKRSLCLARLWKQADNVEDSNRTIPFQPQFMEACPLDHL